MRDPLSLGVAFLIGWVPMQVVSLHMVYDVYQARKHDYPRGERLDNVAWKNVIGGPIVVGLFVVWLFVTIRVLAVAIGGAF